MAKHSKAEREQAIRQLGEMLQPGDTVHTILRHTSRSGMLRIIEPVLLRPDGPGSVQERYLGHLTARVLGWPDDGDQGVKVSGCGMDMGFELVYCLSHALWPQGFECVGEGCPANDHMNGDRDYTPHLHRDGGYALRRRWL